MAILTGINTRLIGSAGEWTFSRQGGRTIARQKVDGKGGVRRTYAQMVLRAQWGNLVNLYRAFGGRLLLAFEGRRAGVSDFNEFMGANLGSAAAVFLTRGEVRQGGCVVSGYQVSRGSLPSVACRIADGKYRSDIATGSLNLGADTTLGQFSAALTANNAGIVAGDQLSCFVARQTVGSDGVPYVHVEAHEVTLDPGDETPLASVVDTRFFSPVEGEIGVSDVVEGALAWVHSRRTPSGTKVSSQRLLAENALLGRYQGEAQRAEAIRSYGGLQTEPFLTPNDTNTAAPANP